MKEIKGKIHKYRNDINTDVIIPTKFCNSTDMQYLGKHCFANLDEEFADKCKKGDVLLVGENFGCGSSRENAPLAIKGAGVACVIGKSFARIFYRNAINIGLPLIVDDTLYDHFSDGNNISINFEENFCVNTDTEEKFNIPPYPSDILEIFLHGGLVQFIKDGGMQ